MSLCRYQGQNPVSQSRQLMAAGFTNRAKSDTNRANSKPILMAKILESSRGLTGAENVNCITKSRAKNTHGFRVDICLRIHGQEKTPPRIIEMALRWRRSGSNRQPPACKAGALPIELRPLYAFGKPIQNRQTRFPIRERLGVYSVLPRQWSRQDSNLGPRRYQRRALTN